jgi:hypothetical protein
MTEEEKLARIFDLFQINIYQTKEENIQQYFGLIQIYLYMKEQYDQLSDDETKIIFREAMWRTLFILRDILFFFNNETHVKLAIDILEQLESYQDIYNNNMVNYNSKIKDLEHYSLEELLETDIGQDLINRCNEVIQLLDPIINLTLFSNYFEHL